MLLTPDQDPFDLAQLGSQKHGAKQYATHCNLNAGDWDLCPTQFWAVARTWH